MKTKPELIAAMAEKTGTTKADTGRMMDAFIAVIQGELTQGEKVRLDGLGILAPVSRAARTGRNPKTGEPVKVPAKNAVKFKMSAELVRMVNG